MPELHGVKNIFICCTSETEIQQFIIFFIACDLNEKKKH